jgi:hypothetical protein
MIAGGIEQEYVDSHVMGSYLYRPFKLTTVDEYMHNVMTNIHHYTV